MISISVRYYNMLRRRTGVEREEIELPAGTALRAALDLLVARHGPRLGEMIFTPEGTVASHLVVFHDRKLVPHDQLDRTLADGDELMLFPAISGG
jgi:MoaD family protein